MSIDVLRNIFERNDHAARENRELLDRNGVTCINMLGGAGSGKTSILEAVLPRLDPRIRVAVLEGDLATTRDAERIAALEVRVVQLLTEGGCHLNATLVQQALRRLPLNELDLLIIENVGNPICPANFDLGEHLRIGVLSVAEGDDKVAKYPLLFKDAAAVVLTKCDLLAYCDFDIPAVRRDLARLNPSAAVFETQARHGNGIDRLVQWLEKRVAPAPARIAAGRMPR